MNLHIVGIPEEVLTSEVENYFRNEARVRYGITLHVQAFHGGSRDQPFVILNYGRVKGAVCMKYYINEIWWDFFRTEESPRWASTH